MNNNFLAPYHIAMQHIMFYCYIILSVIQYHYYKCTFLYNILNRCSTQETDSW